MIPNMLDFYAAFMAKFEKELDDLSIGVLSDFISNKDNIESFNARYVSCNKPRIVICGINPGRLGAGKTGIPFVDFKSLSTMIPNVNKNDSEKTALFFSNVIKHFGTEEFYRRFHVTNLSCLGFYNKKTKKNVNYNTLPTPIAKFLLDRFVQEMAMLKPRIIVPVSDIVNWELTLNLKPNGLIDADIADRLYHPASKFARVDTYIETLQALMTDPAYKA